MLKKIILSSMLLLSSQVYADNLNKIFDIELGSQVDETKDNFISNSKTGNYAIYKIDFKGFTEVVAHYTPITHKIYNIIAVQDSSSTCESDAELVAGILGSRYGKFTKHEKIAQVAYLFKENNKSLIVGCNGLIDKKLSIYFIDTELSALHKKEELKIEAEKEANNF